MTTEANPAPLTIALRARAAETGSGTSLAILLRNAAELIEKLRSDRQFFDHQSRRYYAALKRIAEFTGDVDGAGPIAREALLSADESELTSDG